ncbi:hypothetical protein BT96DRAFT_1010102 [Gymnopus androsaceus JB14]|uniref:Uncharacterized protein n=1 Tax=Gymnopus androsaceus JB14 TaxID=1447944 RepID=A0A6A4GB65_9AGAR|nr:hypothetical protein BT96DRAFT_1010102 [Gymnopus androsaceus JB14]
MSKVGADIRSKHFAGRCWAKRKNHDEQHISDLLAVPQYADFWKMLMMLKRSTIPLGHQNQS